jgi:hypothetical protein
LQRFAKIQTFQTPRKTEIERRKRELARPLTEGQKINAELGAVEDELKTLVSLSNQVTSAANAIGTAFGNSFKGLISGSMTAKEALASFFSSVADHFLDMAAQIIAKMIQMFILQQALKIFGGALGGGGNAATALGSNPNVAKYAPLPRGYAEGGFVTGPTSAIIGEGGESEYVIPSSKMSAAMSRYSRGARGEGVIAGSGGGTEGESGAAAAGPMWWMSATASSASTTWSTSPPHNSKLGCSKRHSKVQRKVSSVHCVGCSNHLVPASALECNGSSPRQLLRFQHTKWRQGLPLSELLYQ